MEIGLFPGNSYLTGGNLFECYFRGRWDIQTQLVDEDLIRGLTDLPGPVEQPKTVGLAHLLHVK